MTTALITIISWGFGLQQHVYPVNAIVYIEKTEGNSCFRLEETEIVYVCVQTAKFKTKENGIKWSKQYTDIRSQSI